MFKQLYICMDELKRIVFNTLYVYEICILSYSLYQLCADYTCDKCINLCIDNSEVGIAAKDVAFMVHGLG